jgi:hypothetical protein
MATTSMMDMTDRMNLHRSGAANNLFFREEKKNDYNPVFISRTPP